MDFKELVSKHRELYVNHLIDFYKENKNGVNELMIELNSEENIREFKLMRIDYFEELNSEPTPTELNIDKYFDFETIEYNYDSLKIEMNPFYWNGCEFILDTNHLDLDWLIKWINKWIDVEDDNIVDSKGLSNVVHSVTKPDKEGEQYTFSVDFGSSNIESFFDLIDEIYLQKIEKLKVGSFSMIE